MAPAADGLRNREHHRLCRVDAEGQIGAIQQAEHPSGRPRKPLVSIDQRMVARNGVHQCSGFGGERRIRILAERAALRACCRGREEATITHRNLVEDADESAVLAFEHANRAYFAESTSDRGDAFFEQFAERHRALLAEQEAGVRVCQVLVDEHGEVVGRFKLYDLVDGSAVVGFRVAQRVAGRLAEGAHKGRLRCHRPG